MQTILAAVDLNHLSNAARIVQAAKQLASDGAQFRLLTVVPLAQGSMVTSFLPKDYDKRVREEVMAQFSQFATTQFNDDDNYSVSVRIGSIYEQVIAYAKEKNVDVIVVAAGKPGRMGIGGNAMRIAQHSDKSVYIIR